MPVNTAVIYLVLRSNGIGVREAVVKKTGTIVLPGDTGKSAPLKSLIIVLVGINGADFDFLPVAAAARDGVGLQQAILANGGVSYSNCAVFTH